MFALPPLIITPNDWPDSNSMLGINRYHPHPGDLTRFLANQRAEHVGANYHEAYTNPMLSAPPSEGEGGTIFFTNDINQNNLSAAMHAMGITDPPGALKQFVIYAAESKKPGEEQYLRQLRFINHLAMRYSFRSLSDDKVKQLPTQSLTLTEAVWLFIQNQRKEWGTSFASSPKLDSLFGGDGYNAREELSFGLMVEDSYSGIVRLWSRAWLVTK